MAATRLPLPAKIAIGCAIIPAALVILLFAMALAGYALFGSPSPASPPVAVSPAPPRQPQPSPAPPSDADATWNTYTLLLLDIEDTRARLDHPTYYLTPHGRQIYADVTARIDDTITATGGPLATPARETLECLHALHRASLFPDQHTPDRRASLAADYTAAHTRYRAALDALLATLPDDVQQRNRAAESSLRAPDE